MNSDVQMIKNRNAVYFFISAIIMYAVVQVVILQFDFLSNKMFGFLVTGSIVAMLYFSRKLLRDFEFENLYFKFIFIILMLYNFIIIIRGFEIGYEQLKLYSSNEYIFWPFVIPLVVFLNKNDLTFFYILKSFFVLGIIFLLICIVDPVLITQRITAEPFIMPFAFTCGFLFLNAKYVSKRVFWVSFISLVVGSLSFIYLARRNAILSFVALIFVGFYFLIRNMKSIYIIRLFPVLTGMAFLFIFTINDLPTTLTSRLNERIKEDSRSELFGSFLRSMQSDMVFGKGMNGNYYFPVDQQTLEDGVTFSGMEYRNMIENGYMQLLLNGGYVYIGLMVLTLLPAVFLGIFKSNNQFTRCCGVIIFLWMVDMAVYGLPRLLLQYILVWICVGVCYKTSFRNKTDEEIAESFEEVGLN